MPVGTISQHLRADKLTPTVSARTGRRQSKCPKSHLEFEDPVKWNQPFKVQARYRSPVRGHCNLSRPVGRVDLRLLPLLFCTLPHAKDK